MKVPSVNIACFDDGHIVPRMMSWLEDGLGWKITNGYDPNSINYLAPYTMLGRYGQPPGPSMAWFTHFEEGNLQKMRIWHQAAKQIDLPLVTAQVYADHFAAEAILSHKSEPSLFKITPGIDQDHFKPVRKKRPGSGVVGLVGVPGPRKGTELAESLTGAAGLTQLLAAGGDWPGVAGSAHIPYDEMPAFYAQLDLMVCASTIEGIPAPPLEALACGVPVVVPRGVGMMDELPESPAVHRYDAGNTASLLAATEAALDATVSRSEARDVVADYTVAAWCTSHQLALEALIAGGVRS